MVRAAGAIGLALMMATAAQAAPIHDAAAANDAAAITSLVKSGIAVDSLNETGETALIVAAKTAEADAVSVLLGEQADPNFVDPSGRRAVHWLAVSGARTAIVPITLLYEKRADMNARDADGATALMLAMDSGNDLLVTSMLFSLGIDFEVTDNAGMTALTRAGLKGRKTIVTVLLRVGAQCQTIDAAWYAACEARRAELGIK